MISGVSATDVGTKALIRRAALTAFAERGYSGASIRAVAAAAGVSHGLVQRHYGNKEGLRAAVDAFVVERAAELLAPVQPLAPADPHDFARGVNTALMAVAHADPDVLRYLLRTLVEGGPSAQFIFDGLMAITRGIVDALVAAGRFRPELDATWGSVQILMLNLGPLVLRPLLEPHLEHPLMSDEGLGEWQGANATLALHGMLSGRTT